MRKLMRRIGWLLLMMLLFTALCLFWITATRSGGNWAIQQAIRISEQPVVISGFNGTLIDSFGADLISYQKASISITLDHPAIDWQLSGLLQKDLNILSLKAESVSVALQTATEEKQKPATVLPELSLPIDIYLDDLAIRSVTITSDATPIELRNIHLSGQMEAHQLTLASLHLEQADLIVDATTDIQFKQPFPLQINATIEQTQWQAGTELEITGNTDQYRLNGKLHLVGDSFPETHGDYAAQGSLQAMTLEQLQLNTLDGIIQLDGKIDWSQQLFATFNLDANNLNPEFFQAAYPGVLSVNGQFDWRENSFKTQFNVGGELRNYPLEMMIEASGTTEMVTLTDSKLISGPNQLSLSGAVSKTAATQLQWQLDATELSTLHDELDGELTASGTLNGPWKSLALLGQLKANALQFNETKIQSINAEIRPVNPETHDYDVALKATDININQQLIDQFSMQFLGNAEQHQLDLNLQHAIASITTHFTGSFDQQQKSWTGEMTEAQVTSTSWPDLKQAETVTISYKDNALEISEFCLQGPDERLCTKASQQPDSSNATLSITGVPLRRFQPWLPQAAQMQENASLNTRLKREKNHWNIDTSISLDKNNLINSTLQLDTTSNNLSAIVRGNFDKLHWLSLFNDRLVNPKGRLSTDLVLQGTLTEPEINGTLRLSEAYFKLPDLGTEYSNLNLNLSSAGKGEAIISGSVTSGSGKLGVKGNVTWMPIKNWSAKLAITGNEFQALNLPEARVKLSPDLKLVLQSSAIRMDGSIRIPEASILLTDLPERAVTVSEDANIIQADQVDKTTSSTLPVHADIQLLLGDTVTLQGKGLDATLGGKLSIHEQPGQPLTARGTIDIVTGSYTAYGQDLELQSSKIIFNGPINQPGLNLRAVRIIDDITAGLQIGGTLDKPESEIFSTPAMAESDAIAYLLTGKPLRATGSSEGTMINSALTSLGVKGSAGIIEQVRNTTGLSTLEFDTGSDSTQTALLIGKYLTPQLYVQYVKRLFLDSDALQLRYEISPHLHLEAESGTSQGIDLIYQFER